MNTEAFFKHWGVAENPFRAEEARDDPVLEKLMKGGATHPDFEKIFGQPDHPHASVVFGEKGSGKTALRLLMEERIHAHNDLQPENKTWVVRYDDLNPILDRLMGNLQRLRRRDGLKACRLEDHMDAIMSLTVTELVDQTLNESSGGDISARKLRRMIRKMSAQRRLDLAELCLLYDQPQSGTPEARWSKMKSFLRMGSLSLMKLSLVFGVIMLVLTVAVLAYKQISGGEGWKMMAAAGVAGCSSVVLLGCWAYISCRLGSLTKKIRREVLVVDRSQSQLKDMLSCLPPGQLDAQPLPLPGEHDSRYQLMRRLIQVINQLGYRNIMVLLDRVDEPTLIKGDPEKMRQVVWPMFDNKFLQQECFGIKLLLPVELRHLLKKEDAAFYQKARLDKQHMVDRLMWSGATLYDLCNERLAACGEVKDERISLHTMFEESVTEQDIIDALGQMEQPRDAFKFIYQVILQHCRNTPDQSEVWLIPKLTLDYARREQSQRLQDLHRGLGPA